MQKFREELGQSLTFHEQDLQSDDRMWLINTWKKPADASWGGGRGHLNQLFIHAFSTIIEHIVSALEISIKDCRRILCAMAGLYPTVVRTRLWVR